MNSPNIWIKCLYAFIFSITVETAIAQNPIADFSSPATVCLNEEITLTNSSSNASQFIWDFCNQDLNGSITTKEVANITAANLPMAVTMAQDGANWFAFVTSRATNKLYRLNFGNSLDNTPAPSDIYDLGNAGGVLSAPKTLRFIKESSVWYAIGINNSGSLFRLTFSSGLGNAPTSGELLGNLDGWNEVEGLDVAFDGTNWIAMVSSYANNKVSLVKIGPSITHTPTGADVLTILNGAADISTPFGSRLIKDGSNWYGFITTYNLNKVYRLSFGSNLFSIPVKDEVYSVTTVSTNVAVQKEGSDFHVFVSTKFGEIHHLNFGSSLANPLQSSANLGGFGVLKLVEGFDLVRSSPIWYSFAVDYNTNKLFSFKFQGNCTDVTANQSVVPTPQGILYNTSGTHYIDLTAISASGDRDSKTKQITVSNTVATAIDFSSGNNACIGVSNTFTSIPNDATISSFNWDLDDGTLFSGGQVTHQFASTGIYNVQLNIVDVNGCSAKIVKAVPIYNQPVSAFNLPTNNPLCTNQQLTFTNISTYDVGSAPSWDWYVNGTAASTAKDLLQAFNSTSAQTIKLKASILGCFNESTQVINSILPGPNLNFTIVGKCENDDIFFTNTTTDPVTGFTWDFGDTQTSNATDATHDYATAGNYTVTLTAGNAAGCQNVTTKNLTIYTKPLSDFSLSLPPFSCSGSPSQFNDLTPNPVDSNLSSWLWDFDDPASGQNSSLVRNAKHTYASAGDYNVSLTAQTNFGCQATSTKKITISQSVQAAFTNTPSCKDKGVQFTDASGVNVKSWNWQIENATYFINNPVHVFSSTGDYPINLTVTSNNNCISVLTKSLNVPTPLLPDFAVEKYCTNQNTQFADITTVGIDPIAERDWKFGTLGTGTGTPAIFTFVKTGSVSVTLDVTAQSGCKYSVLKNVVIENSPIASFQANPEAGVPPLDVNFLNTSSGATSYHWDFNDSDGTTSALESPSFQFTEIGDHVVDLTAFNDLGCSNTFSKIIKAMIPVYDIALAGFNVIKNADGSLTLIAALKNEGNVSLTNLPLQLSIAGITTVSENVGESIGPNATVNHSFNYQIIDPSRLGFLCATIILADDPSPNNNERCILLEKTFLLFDPHPNPADSDLTIDWISKSAEPVSITLIDALGKQILASSITSVTGFNSIKMITNDLNNGVYAVVIKSSSFKGVKKIAVEH